MKKPMKDDSSSSEDESNLQALREAVDQNFFNTFHNNKEEKKSEANLKASKTNDDHDTLQPEEQKLYQGLSQSCRDFIAKKLSKRLNAELDLDEKTQENEIRNNVEEYGTGIKLFKASSTVLSKFDESIETENSKKKKRKKPGTVFDEKTNFLKCKEVSVSPRSVLSQQDTKHWTIRKIGKPFEYKKSKNGTLIEVQK